MRIDAAVMNVLDAAEASGNELRLTGQLDRKLYLKTNEVIEAAGGKWNRKSKAHVFQHPVLDIIDHIILTGEISTPQELGYFPTPRPIVEKITTYAGLQAEEGVDGPGLSVLEPSAGEGAIADLIPFEFGNTLVEIHPKRAEILKGKFPAFHVECADFLTWKPGEHTPKMFDRIVMNPPFAKQDDIRHVNRALEFLAPRGILVSVMASGVIFRENSLAREFRALVQRRGGEFEELPEAAFKESGTMVRTIVVTIPGASA